MTYQPSLLLPHPSSSSGANRTTAFPPTLRKPVGDSLLVETPYEEKNREDEYWCQLLRGSTLRCTAGSSRLTNVWENRWNAEIEGVLIACYNRPKG